MDLESGTVVAGEVHAPLLYETDPRSDEPETLRSTIEDKAGSWDSIVINAWLDSRYQEQCVTC